MKKCKFNISILTLNNTKKSREFQDFILSPLPFVDSLFVCYHLRDKCFLMHCVSFCILF